MKAARTRAANKRKAHKAKPAPAHKAAATHSPAKAAKPQPRTAAQIRSAHLRAFTLGGVACCSAEALAVSARLAGLAVSTADVLALYRVTADSLGAGASIGATLEAALAAGLAGARPLGFAPVALDDPAAVLLGVDLPEGPHAVTLDPGGGVWSWGGLYDLTGEAVIEEAWQVLWPAKATEELCRSDACGPRTAMRWATWSRCPTGPR
jgi:hypothetical protein